MKVEDAEVDEQAVQQRLDAFETLCRERGLPLTVQRRDILRAVLVRDDHPSVDQIFGSVRDRIPGLSRTTVYRVLETLCELGVLRRLHHPGATVRFDGRVTRHHHLVCRLCHKVCDVDSRKLDSIGLLPNQSQGFLIEDFTVHFHGICHECRQSSAD